MRDDHREQSIIHQNGFLVQKRWKFRPGAMLRRNGSRGRFIEPVPADSETL